MMLAIAAVYLFSTAHGPQQKGMDVQGRSKGDLLPGWQHFNVAPPAWPEP